MNKTDVALFVLRVPFGAMMAYHGLNKVIGPSGLSGTQGWFASMGMRWPRMQARLAAGTEIIAGSLLVVGFLTDFACVAIISLMLVAIYTVHAKVGFFIFLPNGGWEYCCAISVVAVSIALLGPGSYSIDETLNWSQPLAVLALPVAIFLTVCHLAMSYRPNRVS